MCRIRDRIARSIMIVSRRLILPCLFLLMFAPRQADALDPTRHISQYGHTAWRVRDGFLGARPNAIAQTADGYLWIGTDTGLVRFDGVRFVLWTPPAGKQLPSPAVYSVEPGRRGNRSRCDRAWTVSLSAPI